MFQSRWVKASIMLILGSLFLYSMYWLQASLRLVFNYVSQNIDSTARLFSTYVIADYYTTTIGQVFRFIGVSLAFIIIFMAWGPKHRPLWSMKNKIATAVLFEGIYFLSLLPISILYLIRGTYIVLGFSYLLQVLSVTPILSFLSLKIWRYDENKRASLTKLVSLSAVGYIIGIWVNNMFRWFSMTTSTDISFLFTGVNAFGFFSTIITLTSAVFLAALGYTYLARKRNSNMNSKLLGVALLLVGVHFIDFLLVTEMTNAWRYVLLTEIWPISFLSLGAVMLKLKQA